MAEMRVDAGRVTGLGAEAWQTMVAAPRALRRRLRQVRHVEKLQAQGIEPDSEGKKLLRRKPALVAALSHVTRPAAGISQDAPPRVADLPRDFEGDIDLFRRRTLKELDGLLDYHLRPQERRVRLDLRTDAERFT